MNQSLHSNCFLIFVVAVFVLLISSCNTAANKQAKLNSDLAELKWECSTKEEETLAVNNFEEFIVKYPDHTMVDSIAKSLAWYYESTRDYANSKRYHDLINTKEQDNTWLILGAELLSRINEIEAALIAYENIPFTELRGYDRTRVAEALVILSWKLQNYELSENYLSQFAEVLSEEAIVLHRSLNYIGKKKYELAVSILKEKFAVKERIENPFVSSCLGLAFVGTEQQDSARFYLEITVKNNPADPLAALGLSKILIQSNECYEACLLLKGIELESVNYLSDEIKALILLHCL